MVTQELTRLGKNSTRAFGCMGVRNGSETSVANAFIALTKILAYGLVRRPHWNQSQHNPKRFGVYMVIRLPLRRKNILWVDLTGPFPDSDHGNKFIFLAVDALTKYTEGSGNLLYNFQFFCNMKIIHASLYVDTIWVILKMTNMFTILKVLALSIRIWFE